MACDKCSSIKSMDVKIKKLFLNLCVLTAASDPLVGSVKQNAAIVSPEANY